MKDINQNFKINKLNEKNSEHLFVKKLIWENLKPELISLKFLWKVGSRGSEKCAPGSKCFRWTVLPNDTSMINSLFQSKDWIDWKKWQNYLNSASLLKCCSWVLPSCISPLCLLSVKGLEWQITAGQSSSVYNMNLYIVISWYYNTNVRLIISWSYISVLCYKQIPIHQSDIHVFLKATLFISDAGLKLTKNQANAVQHPETELSLFENHSHFSYTLSSKNNRAYPKK